MKDAGIEAVRSGHKCLWRVLCECVAKGDELATSRHKFVEVDNQSGDRGSGCGRYTEIGSCLNLPAVGVMDQAVVAVAVGTFGGLEVNNDFNGLGYGKGQLILDESQERIGGELRVGEMQAGDTVDGGGDFIVWWARTSDVERKVCEQWEEERGKFVEGGFGALAAIGSAGGAGAAKAVGFEAFGDLIEQFLGIGFGPWRGLLGVVAGSDPCFFEHLLEEVSEPLLG